MRSEELELQLLPGNFLKFQSRMLCSSSGALFHVSSLFLQAHQCVFSFLKYSTMFLEIHERKWFGPFADVPLNRCCLKPLLCLGEPVFRSRNKGKMYQIFCQQWDMNQKSFTVPAHEPLNTFQPEVMASSMVRNCNFLTSYAVYRGKEWTGQFPEWAIAHVFIPVGLIWL